MERKSAMAYPGSSAAASAHGSSPVSHAGHRRQVSPHTGFSPGPRPSARSSESDHQLEKLEFALAVAMTRGDAARVQSLRDQIALLGETAKSQAPEGLPTLLVQWPIPSPLSNVWTAVTGRQPQIFSFCQVEDAHPQTQTDILRKTCSSPVSGATLCLSDFHGAEPQT